MASEIRANFKEKAKVISGVQAVDDDDEVGDIEEIKVDLNRSYTRLRDRQPDETARTLKDIEWKSTKRKKLRLS